MNPLVNPAHLATANPLQNGPSLAARKVNATVYREAMREAAAPAPDPKAAQPVAASFAREAPFGAERPRYQRPGLLIDLKV
jgi:hypothetical protein